MSIVVVDYDPRWPRIYEFLCAKLRPTLAELKASIEHVGSTSVPGLAAKPVIDIDVVVSESNVARAVGLLATLGYEHRGDLGIPHREAFRPPASSPPHHLYVCPVGSPALANHLAVRDHLRENPSDAIAYGNLKKCIAQKYADDVDAYVEAKTGFLTTILRQRGFSEDAIADVERLNKKPPARRVPESDDHAS